MVDQNFLVGWFFWDPNRVFFVIPWFNHSVMWYGVLFVLGFIIAYYLGKKMLAFKIKELIPGIPPYPLAQKIMDRLLAYTILGTIIGARLGEVFFYDWDYFKDHLIDIFKVWEGGLASHGGFLGILVAISLFYKKTKRDLPSMTLLNWFDLLVAPIALVCGFIRLGNFMNQEIVGTETALPWGVLFGHPAELVSPVPRHPVQLYEAAAYFVIAFALWFWWQKKERLLPAGLIAGVGIILLSLARILLEFFKAHQHSYIGNFPIEMGQLLSLPFLAFGIGLFLFAYKSK